MQLSRRSFVKFGAVASVAIIGVPSLALGFDGRADVLANISRQSFNTYVGTEFNIALAGRTYRAVLSAVKDFPDRDLDSNCFLLDFTTPKRGLGQATYSVSHFALGEFELMMVGHQLGRGSSLIATINRI